MADAFIFDHVRSPRGRGRANGALHEVTPVNLMSQVLGALRDRNELDTSRLDDVVLGCVSPVGEQGACIARTATASLVRGTALSWRPGEAMRWSWYSSAPGPSTRWRRRSRPLATSMTRKK